MHKNKITIRNIIIIAFTITIFGCSPKEEASPAATTPSAPVAPAVPAAPVAVTPAATPAPATAPANAIGKSVYGKVCSLCHAANVGGAPKPGDKADWEPRLATGRETLYKHALESYTGGKGFMPARGASPSLTDDEVKAAVDYMVDKI